MPRVRQIPVHQQDSSAVGGIYLKYLSEILESDMHLLDEHRDDYYVVTIIIQGGGILHCDMHDIHLKADGILIIRPYQVHEIREISQSAAGYFLSIASFLVPDHCREIFEGLTVPRQYIHPSAEQQKNLRDTIELLYRVFSTENLYKPSVIKGVYDALIYQVAALYSHTEESFSGRKSQVYQITSVFRKLLSETVYLQSPSFYAEKLNITTSHLNDCVKQVTGFTVTYWIQDAMILEAKRHLYYTNNTVKETAYSLGFDDHTYFSRLFRKITGETPLSFRKQFRG